jgi:hypothetical protein
MPKWDGLKPLPDHVLAPLLRALICIPRRPESRLILRRAAEPRPPFWDTANDFMVMWRGQKVGRIDLEPKPYPADAHRPWRWFLNDDGRKRMAYGRAATRADAMAAFRRAFETVPDNTIDKSA